MTDLCKMNLFNQYKMYNMNKIETQSFPPELKYHINSINMFCLIGEAGTYLPHNVWCYRDLSQGRQHLWHRAASPLQAAGHAQTCSTPDEETNIISKVKMRKDTQWFQHENTNQLNPNPILMFDSVCLWRQLDTPGEILWNPFSVNIDKLIYNDDISILISRPFAPHSSGICLASGSGLLTTAASIAPICSPFKI